MYLKYVNQSESKVMKSQVLFDCNMGLVIGAINVVETVSVFVVSSHDSTCIICAV